MADSSAFPWLRHLPEDALLDFLRELRKTVNLTEPGPDFVVASLDEMLHAWKATAEVHADPELYKALTQGGGFDEGDFEDVPRPAMCPSNVPHESEPDSARWCVMAPEHAGDHRDRQGFVWNDRDAGERRGARKPLPCGWCFEENGEEIHPHPECPVGSREPRYKQGSIITQSKTVPGARRWEVLDVLDGGYRVRLLFSGFSNGRLEPPIALWPFELCEAHTELEWQKTEPEGVIDENGRASVPEPREGAHDHDRG